MVPGRAAIKLRDCKKKIARLPVAKPVSNSMK
jgi:hypothetical protein